MTLDAARDGQPASVRLGPTQPEPFRALSLGEFLGLQIPPRQLMLAPIIAEKSVNMVYAPRGVGKTHFAIGIIAAVATGGRFLRWEAERPRRVLLLDGEMPSAALQERWRQAAANMVNRSFAEEYVRILASDLFESGLPDLSTEEGQAALEPHIDGAELIVVDNISTLCRTGKENEGDSWGLMQQWALAQRRAGRSVLFLHHSGKGGDQRGTSRREDVMDTVMKLSRPADYDPSEGARFIIEFTKARGFLGADSESLEAMLEDGVWRYKAVQDVIAAQVMELAKLGMTQREIGAELNLSASKVNRIIKKQRDAP